MEILCVESTFVRARKGLEALLRLGASHFTGGAVIL